MTNLLPPELKKELRAEQQQRLIAVLGISLIVPLICFILVLLSLKFYLLVKTDQQQFIFKEAKEKYQTPEFLSLTSIIQKSNTAILRLASFYKQEKDFGAILESLANISRPKGLSFTDFSIIKDRQGRVIVTISGISDSRENLVVFQKNLQESKQLQNLTISPQSWVDAQNVKFYLTFEAIK